MTLSVDFPALNGGVVTERHARICRERGHATHTVDGVDRGSCPRCGDVTEVPIPAPAVFAEMLKLEREAQFSGVIAAFGVNWQARGIAQDRMEASKARLFTWLDTLSPVQAAAFGEYRRTH